MKQIHAFIRLNPLQILLGEKSMNIRNHGNNVISVKFSYIHLQNHIANLKRTLIETFCKDGGNERNNGRGEEKKTRKKPRTGQIWVKKRENKTDG